MTEPKPKSTKVAKPKALASRPSNRLMVELRDDQVERFRQIIPHGMQKLVFQAIADGIITLYNREGVSAIINIVDGYLSIKDLVMQGRKGTKEYFLKEDLS